MPFDALTLHSVRDELAERITDAYVERVVQTGPQEVVLQLFCHPGTRHLLISAENGRERVCLTERPAHRAEAPDTPFLLLLKKHVKGGVIRGIEQPYLERVMRVDLEGRDADGGTSTVALIIEVMGRRSNAILLNRAGIILDALRRVPPSRNPSRPLLPSLPYTDPPPQPASLDPRAPRLAALLAERAGGASVARLAQFVAGNLAGFSPQAGREVAARAAGAADAPLSAGQDWRAVAAAVDEITAGLETHRWRPTVALDDERVVAFAPYVLTHLPAARVEAVDSASLAVERGMAPQRVVGPRAAANVRPLLDTIAERRRSVQRRAGALRHALEGQRDPQELLTAGNALLASLGAIRPGQPAFTFDGVQYPLDPAVPPVRQAQRLFREYQKARDAGRALPRLLEAAERELAYLDDLATLAEVSPGPDTVRGLRAELAAAGLLGAEEQRKHAKRARRQQAASARPLRAQLDGFEVLVGTSARTNELITTRIARPDDVWLHARGVPGAHVLIRTEGRMPPQAVLARAAGLAAAYSAARTAARVEVDWTQRRHVRKVSGGPPGLVTYTHQQSLAVPPATGLPV